VRISLSEVRRILCAAELRPHRVRYWLHSQDPEFRQKVERICELYLSPPPDTAVMCVDEKTCIQALERKHRGRPAAPGRDGRQEFEYIRHGTRVLIAAFDVRTGEVFGQLRKRRTADDLDQFMRDLARRYSRGPVYVVWDNLNIHHGDAWERFNARHGRRFHFVHTPLHASWVNQVEIWFGILQRRILKHGHFKTPEAMVPASRPSSATGTKSRPTPSAGHSAVASTTMTPATPPERRVREHGTQERKRTPRRPADSPRSS
jgi:hypothetical protein